MRLSEVHTDEREPFPPPAPRRRWVLVLLGAVLAVLLAGSVAAVWLERQLHPPGGPGPVVTVTIEPGTSGAGIARLLEKRGVVTNPAVFRAYFRLAGDGTIPAGVYTFRHHDHLSRVVTVLRGGGRSELSKLTLPEGLTLLQIGDRVGQLPGRSTDRFVQEARNGSVRSEYEPAGSNQLEGLLFPDTYLLPKSDDERKILVRMVAAFDQVADEVGYRDAAARARVSPYQAIVVASMVEREAKVDADRGPIARVIYNRLQRGMPLQVDATVEYALGVHKERITDRDLEVTSPYNTYKVQGLPPTPIASPGRKALEAALDPPPGPWLYYVLADASGKHAFATTPADFAKLKAEAHAKGLL